MDARRRHLLGGHASDLFEQLGIPARGERQLGREDGRAFPERVAVDAVLTDEQRNAEAVLRGEVHRAVDLRPENVEDGAGLTGVDEREVFAARVPQHQLADLLLEGHAAEQVGDTFFDGQGGIAVGGSGGMGEMCGMGGSWDKISCFLWKLGL